MRNIPEYTNFRNKILGSSLCLVLLSQTFLPQAVVLNADNSLETSLITATTNVIQENVDTTAESLPKQLTLSLFKREKLQ